MTDFDESAWDDVDRAVQIEDDNPETLAGAEVPEPAEETELHDRLAVGEAALPEILRPTAEIAGAGVENPSAEGA